MKGSDSGISVGSVGLDAGNGTGQCSCYFVVSIFGWRHHDIAFIAGVILAEHGAAQRNGIGVALEIALA